MASPREHVEEIRRKKFSIGGEENPLTEDLHQAVKNLSAELYAKDVHFLMELIQNAEDNEYSASVDPSLEFVITSNDITATGAPATLLIFNNEIGFSPKNIDSICSVGRSTKKGNRKKGYIGEKGIGFKSVFLITSRPYIFSNGYQIRFNEEPCQHCNVGYIVPEWVDQNPNVSEIRQIYGSSSGDSLPTTVLILPLKPDKVGPVRRQLSTIHPQVLLFLSKIKALSIREQNEETVNGVAITKETDFKQRKSMDAESFTLHLNADEDGSAKECSFYMWKQRFPVPSACRVEKRSEVDEWAITLAFPTNGECLGRKGLDSPGIYAFLPTEMVTNFPFVIQADFLLASSRETILLDQEWNRGILRCVSEAFVNAFKSLVEAHRDAPAWILPETFRFLPVEASNYKELNVVRDSIRTRLAEEEVVPSEAVVRQNFLHKPREVGRLDKSFWAVLDAARAEGVKLPGLSSHGKYVLSSPLDREEYDQELEFLGVKPVEPEWYAKCIKGCNLVEKVSDRVYLEILSFVADNWKTKFLRCAEIKDVPLIKYRKDQNETVGFLTMSGSAASIVYLSRHLEHVSWMIGWSGEFSSSTGIFFTPKPTHEAMEKCQKKEALLRWLKEEAKVGEVDVNEFASLVSKSISAKKDRRLVVAFAHFLLHSTTSKGFLTVTQALRLCRLMPVVDSYGKVNSERKGLLVPASGSKWAELVLSNVWSQDRYVELSEDYLVPFRVAGKLVTKENELLSFLGEYARAEDVPHIPIPDSRIPSVSSSLTKENAYMLLEWIRSQKSSCRFVPSGFLASVKEGCWLKITMNGSSGSRPPSQSFLLGASDSSWGDLLQNKSVFVDVPLVDRSFYGERINSYETELKVVGVMSNYSEVCRFVGDRLMSLADSGTLTRTNVLSILKFIRFLRSKYLSPDDFVKTVKKRRWVRTSRGDKSPAETVLFDEKWKTVAKISDIPFVDLDFYGEEIREFGKELALLGVVVGFSGDAECYKLVVENLKPSLSLSSLPADALLLALRCIVETSSTDRVVKALKGTKCIRTKVGYKAPEEVVLCDPGWGFLFQVFDGLPLIDLDFYGETLVNFKDHLRLIGVTVDFDHAAKVFAGYFNDRTKKKSVSKDNTVAFLECFRRLKEAGLKFPLDLKKCFYDAKWLRTRHCDYYRSPRECVLFGPEWKSISPIARLPFVDDTDSGYGGEIHKYKKELNALGVVTKLDDGVKFVAEGIYFHSVELIGAETALALLECVAVLRKKGHEFPPEFIKKLSQPWLRTSSGYKSPNKCLFFDSEFAKYLKATDGPFVDREFYGPKIVSYSEVLGSIGVVVDVEKGCELIASELESQTEFLTVTRFYTFLNRFHWNPKAESEKKIWIPNGDLDGDWAILERCVVSDETGLFSSQLIVLDEHYEENHLSFFSTAFGVKPRPRTEDYRELWKTWEVSGRVLSHDECCKFWSYMAKNLTPELEKTLAAELEKVPVKLKSNHCSDDDIVLMDKKDVFIADDLQLKDLFEKSRFQSLFVWYPEPSPASLPRTKLLQLFQKLGVRTISESVVRREEKLIGRREILPGVKSLIGKGLARLVLGFLAVKMEAKDRHRALGELLKLSVVETDEPIEVRYDLSLSTGKTAKVRASKTVRWERGISTIFTQTRNDDVSPGHVIERATCFSEVVAEGVLWESGERVRELAELVRLAFLMDFHVDAVEFLMKSNNLQTFVEDDEFVASAFPAWVSK